MIKSNEVNNNKVLCYPHIKSTFGEEITNILSDTRGMYLVKDG